MLYYPFFANIFKVCLFFILVASQLHAEQDVNLSLQKHIHYQLNEKNWIGHILIEKDHQISQSTWLYVQKALEEYKKSKPAFIILELNTRGRSFCSAKDFRCIKGDGHPLRYSDRGLY